MTERTPAAAGTLRVDRSTWRPLVQFLPHAVLLLDDRLRIVVANRAAARLFQLPAVKMTGAPLTSLIPGDKIVSWLAGSRGQRTRVLETPVDRGPAAPRMMLRIVAVELAHRRVPGVYRLLVVEDITDRAALEQQLVESEKQAAMGQLAAGILHEVANPLAGLGSNLVFVRGGLRQRSYDELEQALDVSLEQLHQMRLLLGTLSGFPRRTAPVLEPVNLVELVRRAIAFIASDAKRHGVLVRLAADLDELVCELDARLIRQVLLNVLKNALEALPSGGSVDVRLRRTTDGGSRTAVIEVLDTGVGVLPADLRRVFRPLFSTKPRGAGLGLSFCRQTIEEHGGLITVRSQGRGHGTQVTVSLPQRQIGSLEDEGSCDADTNDPGHR